ncbi:M23 family metallopeptidase [Ramlibacter sp. XY19]|uniref:M23 family metallopeptidase n=1 Tax=Ramlibacter paludis TaxID=2908000 RepID=UPI0023DA8A14|nr:M23 family metallopeptidase [Ramlibacter paludis]MCG2591398.1 M23 family metallopeptidase [Ramlibacter paludis]
MKSLISAGEQLASRAKRTLEHHPRQITAVVAALLLCGGGGAYAVASLGPDPSLLPVREVLEHVETLPLDAQVEALDGHRFSLYSSDTVRKADSVDSLLGRLGINDPVAATFLRQDPAARQQLLAVTGRTISVEATDNRNLSRLTVRWSFEDPTKFKRLVVERQADGKFASRIEVAPLTASLRVGTGVVRTSLYAAVDDAGIPDAVTSQLVEVFSGTIDFHRGLRVGDQFAVVYETLEADGEPLRTGRVISADFTNAGRRLDAMWFQEPGQRGGYYNFQGQSLERAFLASPLAVSRVTSSFKMRFHPILHTWIQHNGVDYGAPTGTPVRSVGEGRVDYAGRMNGYGNVVQIDHGKGDTTVYAHLSRVDVRLGQPVQRGQVVGAVGATGWATGPHLHFEFRENGRQRDPIEVARQSQPATLSAAARPAFDKAAESLRAQLAAVTMNAPQLASAR